MKLISQIKKDLDFNRNLAGLIDVLKEIAIFQYHVMEKKVGVYNKIFDILRELFESVPENIQHPFLNAVKGPPCVIAITSDAGLMGALNMQVMSCAIREVETSRAKLIIIGEKGKFYAQDSAIAFVAFEGIKDERRLEQAMQLRDYIINEGLNNRIGAVKVFYPYASSLIAQRIQALQILPMAKPKKEQAQFIEQEIILESLVDNIVTYLVYLFLGQEFYEIFGFSRLAEMAARFVHLEDSGHKLEDIEKQLRLQYFRQRHELIDRSMRELFASRRAFR